MREMLNGMLMWPSPFGSRVQRPIPIAPSSSRLDRAVLLITTLQAHSVQLHLPRNKTSEQITNTNAQEGQLSPCSHNSGGKSYCQG